MGAGMTSITGWTVASTWQGWSVRAASSVLGYASEDTDLLGEGFLSVADGDLVTLSAEAQAVLEGRESDSPELSEVVSEMSASQIGSMTQSALSGEVLGAMLGDLDALDVLAGSTS